MKIHKSQYDKICLLYNKGKSQSELAVLYNVCQRVIWRILKKNNCVSRTAKENAIKNNNHLSLEAWRKGKNYKLWNKGLTKETSEAIKLSSIKGSQTQIKNGKSKGRNNAMWGKPSPTKIGFREDLQHIVRSSWEANFARILRHLGIKYEYEKYTFDLGDTTYTPDFYIPSKNKFYEIKGYEHNSKYEKFKILYPDIKLIVIKEPQYTRLLQRFKNVNFEDKIRIYTKDQLSSLYKEYILQNDNFCVQKFCESINISFRFIIRTFGGMQKFKSQHADFIEEYYTDKLKQSIILYKQIYGTHPTRIQLLYIVNKSAYTQAKRVFGHLKIPIIINSLGL